MSDRRTSDRRTRRAADSGSVAEARSATALFLALTAVIAGAIALAAALADGEGAYALVAGLVAIASFVVSMFCFSADAETQPMAEPSGGNLAAAASD